MKAFFNKISSFFLEGGLKETVLRFPLSVICAVILCALVILDTHNLISDSDGRIPASLGFGFFWFGFARLIAQSREWNYPKEMVLAFAAFIPVALLMMFAQSFAQYLIFIIPATLLLLMIAPYLTALRETKNDSDFWSYNMTLWTGVLFSFVAIAVLLAGLMLAIESVKALFDVKISHRVFSDIWAISAFLVGPIYALSLVPKDFTSSCNECKEPPGLAFMLNWILAPLIILYFIILYAYLIKIIVMQELPLGTLAYMVTGFAGVSIATYLTGWPLREKAGAMMSKIYKYLFPALAVPVALQFIAIGERIYTFGMTEQRYMVLISAIWLSIIIFLFVFKKAQSIKIIPALLAALLLFASFGPWGAPEDKRQHPINDMHGGPAKNISSYDLTKLMGFDYVSHYARGPNDGHFALYGPSKGRSLMNVRGYDYVSQSLYAYAIDPAKMDNNRNKIKADENSSAPEVTWFLDQENNLKINVAGRGDVSFDLTETVKKARKNLDDKNRSVMALKGYGSGMKVNVIFTQISGKLNNDVPEVKNVSFSLLLDL